MPMHYVAHGLAVSSPFALPGMSERQDPSLPSLDLDLYTVASVQAAWDENRAKRIWQGTLGEGTTLLLEASPDGSYLFSFDNRALFLLDSVRGSLACAPCEAGIAWQRVLLTKVLPTTSLLRGYESLHASAVASPEGAVLILAPSGTGKTALAMALAQGGWPLLSDDVLVLAKGPGSVLAFPATPHVNVEGHGQERCPPDVAEVLGLLGDELWAAVLSLAQEPSTVSAVCLLERGGPGPLQVSRLAGTPLALAPYMLGLDDAATRERERFELYSELMADASLIRIRAGARDTPSEIAHGLREVLAAAREPEREAVL